MAYAELTVSMTLPMHATSTIPDMVNWWSCHFFLMELITTVLSLNVNHSLHMEEVFTLYN